MAALTVFLKFWPLIHVVASVVILWICWSLRQLAIAEVNKIVSAAVAGLEKSDEKTETAVKGHEGRISDVEHRVGSLEEDIRELPTKADLKALEGELKVVGKAVEQVHRGVSRIEDHFMEEGMKGAKS